jgi:hypothetical protein
MEQDELWTIEGDLAEHAFTAFRAAWFAAAPEKRVNTGEDLEAIQRVFAARWTQYRRDGV